MERPLILGTRGSPLALAQATMVAAALEAAHRWPRGQVRIATIRTSGDRIQDRPLAEVGGKALWTKELDRALLSGETDLSVHSMKDVESERPDALVIAAMLERADVRDRLIGAGAIADLARGARVGTSSPRRLAQVRRLRPDLVVEPIRGNVDTRLARQAGGSVDATLLAAAGLDRLGKQGVGHPVPIEEMLPAPAQAAIGIECRTDDHALRALLGAIDHRPTHAAVALERAMTRALGGTCHSPVAALAEPEGDGFRLRAALYSADGQQAIEDRCLLGAGDLAGAAAFGRALLAAAPAAIQALFAA